MRVELILVPYDSGRRGERMGAGPEALLAAGLDEQLRGLGVAVGIDVVELPPHAWPAEAPSAFALAAGVADRVRAARADGAFPLVLSGNCGPAAIGATAALGAGTRVFWFDAHGDFNTPETSGSGFLDGMSLATLCGRCWRPLSTGIDGFTPVAESDVVLSGVRDLDAGEAALLDESDITQIVPARLRTELPRVLGALPAASRPANAYVHLDLDALDPAEGRVNSYAAPGGLTAVDIEWALQEIGKVATIAAAAMTAYDPAADTSGQLPATLRRLAAVLVSCATRAPRRATAL